MAVKFPSLEFFQELARQMQKNRAEFEKLGFCDTTMGVTVAGPTPRRYALAFEVFECSGVRELPTASEGELDFTLEASLDVWQGMLRSIREKGKAEPAQTLNSLSHLGDRMRVVYDDPEGHDKFYRFMATLQAFFDQASQIDVEGI